MDMGELDDRDRAVLNAFQGGFPVVERPFESAAGRESLITHEWSEGRRKALPEPPSTGVSARAGGGPFGAFNPIPPPS